MNPSQPEKKRALQADAEQGAKLKLTTMRKPYPRIGQRQWLAEFKLRVVRERLGKKPPATKKSKDAAGSERRPIKHTQGG